MKMALLARCERAVHPCSQLVTFPLLVFLIPFFLPSQPPWELALLPFPRSNTRESVLSARSNRSQGSLSIQEVRNGDGVDSPSIKGIVSPKEGGAEDGTRMP